MDPDTLDTVEAEFDVLDAEYLFLTESLGWKEGLNEYEPVDADIDDVTKLAEYLFLTEQMGWRKGLKVLGEKGEVAIEKELQQIHDMDGFEPKHWHELTQEERSHALK